MTADDLKMRLLNRAEEIWVQTYWHRMEAGDDCAEACEAARFATNEYTRIAISLLNAGRGLG